LLEGPLQTSEFLRLAVALTNAPRQMHERGLIHKDIKPGNIFAHTASGGDWLTGSARAAEIALLRPEAPIVPMSSFAGAQLHKRARALGIRELLRKPLQRKDIAECFARVLPS
jgi:serine/threonine protein kinase